MNTCKLAGCPEPTRGYGLCDPHRAVWRRGEPLTVPIVPAVPEPAPVVEATDVSGRQRCTHCTRWFWVLVDGDLCVHCDSLLYPMAVA